MPQDHELIPRHGAQRLRLNTLIRLRWLAVVGQSLAVLIVHSVLEFALPLGLCFAAIALSAWLNIFLRLRFKSSIILNESHALILLAYDILQLAALLYLTGGLQNPFAILMLAPVMVSATALQPQKTILLGLLVSALATILAFQHLPLPWVKEADLQLPLLYITGFWIAIVSTLAFMSVYAFRVAKEARELNDALTATELVLAREQHLSALDGLAAAAAHELGTPLGTIAVVIKEMQRESEEGSHFSEDLHLLKTQSERCREILAKLTSLSSMSEDHLAHMTLDHMIEEVIAPLRDFDIEISFHLDTGRPPRIKRNPGILHGLGNILENATDFANKQVQVFANWTETDIKITILDDGDGFALDIIERIGEPYVTGRSKRINPEMTGGGLGLGYFIAKTLLERSGAHIALSNRLPPESGAKVEVTWPRDRLEENDDRDQFSAQREEYVF